MTLATPHTVAGSNLLDIRSGRSEAETATANESRHGRGHKIKKRKPEQQQEMTGHRKMVL